MSTRYIKGERFRVRSSGAIPPRLHSDDSTPTENRERVAAVLAAERRAIERRTGRCLDHDYPLSLCPYGCSGLA